MCELLQCALMLVVLDLLKVYLQPIQVGGRWAEHGPDACTSPRRRQYSSAPHDALPNQSTCCPSQPAGLTSPLSQLRLTLDM